MTINEGRLMDINSKDTALLVTDPQNDFLVSRVSPGNWWVIV